MNLNLVNSGSQLLNMQSKGRFEGQFIAYYAFEIENLCNELLINKCKSQIQILINAFGCAFKSEAVNAERVFNKKIRKSPIDELLTDKAVVLAKAYFQLKILSDRMWMFPQSILYLESELNKQKDIVIFNTNESREDNVKEYTMCQRLMFFYKYHHDTQSTLNSLIKKTKSICKEWRESELAKMNEGQLLNFDLPNLTIRQNNPSVMFLLFSQLKNCKQCPNIKRPEKKNLSFRDRPIKSELRASTNPNLEIAPNQLALVPEPWGVGLLLIFLKPVPQVSSPSSYFREASFDEPPEKAIQLPNFSLIENNVDFQSSLATLTCGMDEMNLGSETEGRIKDGKTLEELEYLEEQARKEEMARMQDNDWLNDFFGDPEILPN